MKKDMERIRILIVEDESITALDLQHVLIRLGYEISGILRYGEEAVDFFEKSTEFPDIILMDVQLAGNLSGTETASLINLKKNVPVIYISAYSDDQVLLNARLTNPFGYILKPFNEKILHIAIEMALYKHKLEFSLQESARKQKELNSAKDKFFSLISHDLRSPFNSLIGFIDILKTEYYTLTDNEKQFFIDIIYNSAKNIFDQLNDLLEYSGLKTGMMNYQPSRVNLKEIILKAIELHSANSLRKNITVLSDVPDDLNVYAGEEMLYSVFHNLISNSVKFTRQGGYIKISAVPNGEFVECIVEDNGIGMDEKILNNLFKPEMKQSTPGTENETGTGLGLLIVKEFIEKNGGTIKVNSTPGSGSLFSFKIPKF